MMNFSRRLFLASVPAAAGILSTPFVNAFSFQANEQAKEKSSELNPQDNWMPLTIDLRDCFQADCMKALQFANQEAQRFQHDYLGTEHLVIGLHRCWESIDPDYWQHVGYSIPNLRDAVLSLLGKGNLESLMGRLGKSDELNACLHKAVEMANAGKAKQVYTEHMMAAVMALSNSTGRRIVSFALRSKKAKAGLAGI